MQAKFDQSEIASSLLSEKNAKDRDQYRLRIKELKFQNIGMKDLITQLQSQVSSIQTNLQGKDLEFHNRLADLSRSHKEEKMLALEQQKQILLERHSLEVERFSEKLEASRNACLSLEMELKSTKEGGRKKLKKYCSLRC